RAQSDLRGIQLHRGQSLADDRRRTVHEGFARLRDADPEESAAAGSEIFPEVLAGEEVRMILSPSPRAPGRRSWRSSRIGPRTDQIEIAQGGKMCSSSWSIVAGAGLLLAFG